MEAKNTNWGQSVTGIVIKDDKVLLARHTYGDGKGMLIIPGGYVNIGETPQDALVREYMEEAQIKIKPLSIIGVRFNMHDWSLCLCEYLDCASKLCGVENGGGSGEGLSLYFKSVVSGVQYLFVHLPFTSSQVLRRV